jgi:hypothetical protein
VCVCVACMCLYVSVYVCVTHDGERRAVTHNARAHELAYLTCVCVCVGHIHNGRANSRRITIQGWGCRAPRVPGLTFLFFHYSIIEYSLLLLLLLLLFPVSTKASEHLGNDSWGMCVVSFVCVCVTCFMCVWVCLYSVSAYVSVFVSGSGCRRVFTVAAFAVAGYLYTATR